MGTKFKILCTQNFDATLGLNLNVMNQNLINKDKVKN